MIKSKFSDGIFCGQFISIYVYIYCWIKVKTTQQGESGDATPPVINTTFDWTNQIEVRNQQDISNAEFLDHQTNAELHDHQTNDIDEETNLDNL